jgi:hypothetical protein
LPSPHQLCDSDERTRLSVPRSRIGAPHFLRHWLAVAVLAVVGCSADGIHTPQKFFPGSTRTSWEECNKFGQIGNEVAICASTGLLPNSTSASYNIQFSIPSPAHIRIAVFDEHAALVKVLFDADEPATLQGSFRIPPISWDFKDASGQPVPAGDYRLYFQSGEFTSTSDVRIDE